VTGPEHEDEFEAYLKRRLPIHQRLSALERLEPPDELDRLVIRKARQAIQSRSPIRVFRAPKWALPVGLAATIVISFTVLLNLGAHAVKHQEEPVLMTNVGAEPSPANTAHMAPAPEVVMAPMQSSDAKRAAGASGPVAPQKARDSAAHRELAKAPREIDAGAPAAADRPVETQSTAIADTFNRPLPAPSANSAIPPDTPPRVAGPSEPVAQRQVLPSETQSTGIVDSTTQHVAAASPPPLPDAASWFKRIEKLRAAGKTAEAEQEFRRFRDAYPDYQAREGAPPTDGPTK
jgi:hypothetical protein